MALLPNGRSFCPGVRVGNWYEDIALEADRIKDYIKKRDNGELMCEKRSGISELVSRKAELSTTRDGKVHFGDRVLLINPEPSDKSRPLHTLTLTWTDLFLHDFEEIACAESGKVAASSCNLSPNYRNVFTVTSCDGSHDGEVLRYNQPFYLTAANRRMHLSSDRFDFQHVTKLARQPQVTVENLAHYLAEWKVLPFDPCIRLELQYSPVPANSKIIFTHCKTHRNLCLEPFPFKSSFGHELEVSIHTCLDSHRAETEANHWMFSMHFPGDCFLPVPEPNPDAVTLHNKSGECYDVSDADQALALQLCRATADAGPGCSNSGCS